MAVLVLLRIFTSSNKGYNAAYALYRKPEQNSFFKKYHSGPTDPKGKENTICTMAKYG